MLRRQLSLIVSLFGASLALGAVIPAAAETIGVRLTGDQEVPVIATDAAGTLRIKIHASDETIDYTLSFHDLKGTVTQAHIHVGQKGVAGGISAWLCGTAALPGPAGTPSCPLDGSVSGTLTTASVIGPTVQLVTPGDMATLIAAIRAGLAYGNVHSTSVPGGEIRAQFPTN